MAEVSLNLRIASIFIIAVASAAGIGLPFILAGKDQAHSGTFRCLKAAAAGVMFGIAIMHLLPEANEELSEIVPEYSLAFALTALGVVLNLILEQLAVMYLASQKYALPPATDPETSPESGRGSPADNARRGGGLDALEHGERCGFVKCEHGVNNNHVNNTEEPGKPSPFSGISSATYIEPKSPKSAVSLTSPRRDSRDASAMGEAGSVEGDRDVELRDDATSDGGAELVASLVRAEGLRELVALYMMEVSISVHSIIIGVDIGLLAGDGTLTTLVALICAMAFHQVIEGMGLGTVLLSVRGQAKASFGKLGTFVAVFICGTPLGIVIGICTASMDHSQAGAAAKGTANALAAGSLLYISLTEMLAHYFGASDLARRPAVRLGMICSFTMAIGFMALIAVWA